MIWSGRRFWSVADVSAAVSVGRLLDLVVFQI